MGFVMDLNCDLGEGIGNDTALMPYISSCSIACGGHAGDVASIIHTLEAARVFKLKVGAHPSYPDREYFGRKSLTLPPAVLQRSIRRQLQMFSDAIQNTDLLWHHVKAHGALYNDMATNRALALTFLEAVTAFSWVKKIYCLAGSPLVDWIREAGLKPVEEGFCDRGYHENGQLLSRKSPQAVFDSEQQVLNQARQFVSGYVYSASGKKIPMEIATICIHSDTPDAARFVKALHVFFEFQQND